MKKTNVDNFSVSISILGEEEGQHHPVYSDICGAVGDLTTAILEAKLRGVLTPIVAGSIHGFLGGVQGSLEEHMTGS